MVWPSSEGPERFAGQGWERVVIHGIYAITAGSVGRDGKELGAAGFVDRIVAAWCGGAGAVQIRVRDASAAELLGVGQELLRRGFGRGTVGADADGAGRGGVAAPQPGLLLINGACVAAWPWHLVLPDGLHLGAGNATQAREHLARVVGGAALDLPYVWSAHTAEEARAAFISGAAAVTISPIFSTASHPGQPAGGLELLRETVQACGGRPVLALGGVGPGRVRPCREAGAAGVAMIGAVFAQENVETATAELVTEWQAE